jgi:mannose-6-phosphate isomerase-like protein (cupin superfamily)
MRLPTVRKLVASAAVIGALALAWESPTLAQRQQLPGPDPSSPPNAGLILNESEGELRLRRPGGNNSLAGPPTFTIKVDRKYGGSSSFFMGMEDIAPGKKIRRHHHPHAEEILFVHRGSGIVRLGSREVQVSAGGTVFIPRNVSVGLRNTGTEPLTLVFIFPEPDGMSSQMRSGSVAEGETAVPFTPAELAARNARASDHIVFDEPATP